MAIFMDSGSKSAQISWMSPFKVLRQSLYLFDRFTIQLSVLTLAGQIPSFFTGLYEPAATAASDIGCWTSLVARAASAAAAVEYFNNNEEVKFTTFFRPALSLKLFVLAVIGNYFFYLFAYMVNNYKFILDLGWIGLVITGLLLVLLPRFFVVYTMAASVCALGKKKADHFFADSLSLAKGHYLEILFYWSVLVGINFAAFKMIRIDGLSHIKLAISSSLFRISSVWVVADYLSFFSDSDELMFRISFGTFLGMLMILINVVNGVIFAELYTRWEEQKLESMAKVFE
jgi:hypothetical protein